MLTLGVIGETITSAGIWLVSGVYHVAAWSFELFIILASGQLLETSVYQLLIKNFYVILGIVMLFFLSFTLLKGMVNPDDQNKGTSTAKKVLINLVTSAIIMALLPTIFTFLFDFQTSVISTQNTIGKFFGYGGDGEDNSPTNKSNLDYVKTGAFQIANGVYTAFFNVNTSTLNCPDITSEDTLKYCQTIPKGKNDFGVKDEDGKPDKSLKAAIDLVDEKGSFGVYTNFSKPVSNDEIDFNFILSLVGGILLAYVGISFCIDMAVRLVKLVFYQLIAPIPIFARIIPDTKLSSSFNQWLKVTLTCYMEVFVRIFTIYFTIFLCKSMLDSHFIKEQVYEYGGLIALFAKAFIFMGIIIFMRQAPKLISEVTGIDSGNMKLGLKDKLKDAGVFTAGAAIGGGLTAAARNFTSAYIGKDKWKNKEGKVTAGSILKTGVSGLRSTTAGAASGLVRSGKAGWNAGSVSDMKGAASSGAKGAVEKREKRANYKAAKGGTFMGVVKGHTQDTLQAAKRYAMDESVEGLTRESQNMGKIVSRYSTFSDTIENLLESEHAKGSGSAFLRESKNNFSDIVVGKDDLDNDIIFETVYNAFSDQARKVAEARAQFNAGQLSAGDLQIREDAYTAARDAARDAIMNITLQGSKGKDYGSLSTKGQAVLKDSMVNAQSLQATILENASSRVVQDIMGSEENGGNGALQRITKNQPLTADDFKNKAGNKLKDEAKVAQGQADIKIAELNKEQAAKGDSK